MSRVIVRDNGMELFVLMLTLGSGLVLYFGAGLPDWALWPTVGAACCAIAYYASKPILAYAARRAEGTLRRDSERILSHMREIVRGPGHPNIFVARDIAESLQLKLGRVERALRSLRRDGLVESDGEYWKLTQHKGSY